MQKETFTRDLCVRMHEKKGIYTKKDMWQRKKRRILPAYISAPWLYACVHEKRRVKDTYVYEKRPAKQTYVHLKRRVKEAYSHCLRTCACAKRKCQWTCVGSTCAERQAFIDFFCAPNSIHEKKPVKKAGKRGTCTLKETFKKHPIFRQSFTRKETCKKSL